MYNKFEFHFEILNCKKWKAKVKNEFFINLHVDELMQIIYDSMNNK